MQSEHNLHERYVLIYVRDSQAVRPSLFICLTCFLSFHMPYLLSFLTTRVSFRDGPDI